MASLRHWALSLSLASASLFSSGCVAQDADEPLLHAEIGRANNQSLLWGPYRPNLYFGVRPRIPKSLMAGLVWARVDSYTEVQNTFRYTCEQNEGMAGYGWDEYDARRGGIQTIHDSGNGIDITTSFVKVPGGDNGGSWAVRIKGEPREENPDAKTTVIFFLSQEGEGAYLEPVVPLEEDTAMGFSGDVTLKGKADRLGDFKLVVTKGKGEHPKSDHVFSEERDLEKTTVQSLTVSEEHMWQAKAVVMQQIKMSVDKVIEKFDPTDPPPPWQVYQMQNLPGQGNVHLVQKIFDGSFEFDLLFSSGSAGKELTSDDVTREIQMTSEAFNERFSSSFELQQPFTADKYKKFARSMFSNLIGGIGYFYGHAVADRSYAPEYEEENEGFWEEAAEARARHRQSLDGPYELFTSVPSRPFFPRGFLWDEGFHLLPIADWDMDLTLEVVKSWFNLMDEDGWIAREQILGAEARSKVPTEFQVQYPHYANPPTLFFIVNTFVEQLRKVANGSVVPPAEKGERLSQDSAFLASAHLENPEVGLEYLRNLYPRLRRQFDWFRRTQFGDIRSYDREAFSSREAYRWRGRTEAHVLTSGLDDYPRPQPPHPGELHVDLMAWMGMMTQSLVNVADLLGLAEEVSSLKTIREAIAHNVDDLHWSEEEGCYCDATIDDFEENKLVCHRGYISLFPLLVGLLEPSNPKVGRLLTLLGDKDELFSPHGIRSLSKKDPLYGTAENYWRSPVWMNINYMAVVRLHDLATQQGPFRAQALDLYSRLRRNLVDTVYKSWEETGFAWEQYNPETGKGQRTQHFTGWTSLVVKIMTMPDLSGNGGHAKDEL
ncbi:glycoside hydrolase, family 63 [Grosmannia clavigera kw1407]|uniref:Mannosyl-oligosaccharide glucosidase n=1 Tax=Grosmannia clavigera (strain kw1407 / UAMH 11150) TaxID=655863 RepID=F0XKZ0_GROCL|nr:glycoside hydrolase, family 63 [Grosmannia clavigera kw1407]EFX01591.1 glycoside hydrolase, family 63 [Grosmannia clavigera kw1407]